MTGSDKQQNDTIFERVLGDGLKDKVKQVVGEFKLPKEALNYILKQVDETKDATVGIVTKELRVFLQQTDLSKVIADVLTRVSLEVTTNVKFKENDETRNGIKIKVTTNSEHGDNENSENKSEDKNS